MNVQDLLYNEAKSEFNKPMAKDSLQELNDLAVAFKQLSDEIEDLEAKAKEKKALLSKISTEDIPNLLAEKGLSEIKLGDGSKIKVSQKTFTKITDQSLFMEFLKARGEDDIVKLQVKFDKMAPEKRRELEAMLIHYDYSAKEDVHHQTKDKYFRELLGASLTDEAREIGLQNGSIMSEKDIESFATVYTSFETKIK